MQCDMYNYTDHVILCFRSKYVDTLLLKLSRPIHLSQISLPEVSPSDLSRSRCKFMIKTIAMAAPTPTALPQLTRSKPEGIDLYGRFALAGALGCSITHGAFTPVDV